MLEKEIRKVFSEYPDIIYGFTDISYCSYKESYRSALVLAVPYGEQLSPDNYTEERFEQGIRLPKAVWRPLLRKQSQFCENVR